MPELLEPETETYDVGCLVARFQVPDLHDGHRQLLETVISRHKKVVVFLGKPMIEGSTNNPLDFDSRKHMLKEVYPDIDVFYIKDRASDVAWSEDLDEKVADQLRIGQTAVLYGSRDSFLTHYTTKRFPTISLLQTKFLSGSAIRDEIARSPALMTRDYRWGVIHQALTGYYPTSFQCTDLVAYDEDKTHVMLGRRRGAKLFRFMGGFVDPSDQSLEAGVLREGREESTCEFADPEYICSMRVDDARYRNEPHKIMTAVIKAKYIFGRPTPSDDLAGGELRWFVLADLKPTDLVPEHRPILEAVLAKGI